MRIIKKWFVFGLIMIVFLLKCDANFSTEIPKNNSLQIPVLLYHHFYDDIEEEKFKNNSVAIHIKQFAEQMKWLYQNGYKTITLSQLKRFVQEQSYNPKKVFVITIDDGYRSNYLYAYPILKKYKFKATIFIIGHLVPDTPYYIHDPRALPHMSIKEMLKTKDVFSFGYHTYNLHSLTKHNVSTLILTNKIKFLWDFYYNDLVLQSIVPVPYFAYPYGQYTQDTINMLQKLGIQMAFTTKRGYVKKGDDLYQLKRISVTPNMSMQEFTKIFEN